MLEAAGGHEGIIDRLQTASMLIDSSANGVEIAERGKERQRARKHAFALEQPEQSPGAGLEEAFAHRRRHDRARVDQ